MAITKPRRKHYKIKPKERLEWLQGHRKAGSIEYVDDLETRRIRFSGYKKCLPDVNTQECYICREVAEHWHHIVYLSRGGVDCFLNLVPLCKRCHKKVHRHDPIRYNRKAYVEQLNKPTSFSNLEGKIAYIPPKDSEIKEINPFLCTT